MAKIKILIVEDEVLISEHIAGYLHQMGFEVAGIAYDSERALDMLATRHPDAVLLDVSIGGSKDGIELGEIINKNYHLPFLYLTSHSDKVTIERAKVTMPYGYLVKPFDERDLMTSLEMALYRHGQMHQNQKPSLEKLNASLDTPLTPKEFEIALDIYEGFTYKEIAGRHFVSINTVKSHLKNVYLKLDVSNRTGVIHQFQRLAQ